MVDTKKVLLCPACGTLMTKVYLPEENIDLDFCNECGGVFFDNGELVRLDGNKKIAAEIIKAKQDKFYNSVDKNLTRRCPVCNVDMRKVKIADFEIDFCDECGGKFLDDGEFKKLQEIKDINGFVS